MPFLMGAREAGGQAEAFAFNGGGQTFAALDRAAEKVARQLLTLGIRPGEVVALKGHPDAPVLAALHGIWKAGGVTFPMNPRWTPAEEGIALGAVSPRLLLLGEGMAPVPAFREQLRLGKGDGSPDQALDGLWPDTGPLPFDQYSGGIPDALAAACLLTSGTAGSPRKVELTFGNLRASARGVGERLSLAPSDRWLASLSVAHVGGLALVSRAALLGSSLFLAGSFRGEALQELVTTGAVTHASLVPTMLRHLLDRWGDRAAPGTLRCLLIGGASADQALVERALALGFPLALTYGLTEATSQVATAPPALVARKPGTVGSPLPGVDLRISSGGEILVRGAIVAPGQEDTDGWLHTGDLGRLDGDGHLWVTGRISHRIISGGVNVDPAEVEAVLRTHPGVRDAVVVGLPDPEWGERVVAALVSNRPGAVQGNELDRLTGAVLSAAKRPREFRVVESFPRNANGKVDRDGVRALFGK